MKKLFSVFALVVIANSIQSQTTTGDNNNEDYVITSNEKEMVYVKDNNTNYVPKYSIAKMDIKTKKEVSNVFLNIPDKGEVAYITGNTKISTFLVDNEIQIIYDVYVKKEDLKKCYIKTLGIKGGPLSEAKLLGEAPCKSRFSIANTIFRVIYSPDKSKFALLLDNYSKGIVIEPSITVYDAKTRASLSTKKLKSMYNGTKIQIDPYNNFKIDNEGNISLLFNTHNDKTNMVIKSYQGDIPFKENDIKNIKEAGVASSDNVSGEVSKYEPGRFYSTFQDYVNNKPLDGYKVKNGSYAYGNLAGESFKLIDKDGNIEKEKLSKFPTTLFTYHGEYDSSFDLYRAFEEEAYRVITVGNTCLYAHREATGNGGEKDALYYSEGGINGGIKKFKENDLEGWLEKANLLEEYKKDKPKREFKDDVSGFYSKEVNRYIKYIDMLNKKK